MSKMLATRNIWFPYYSALLG